MSMTFNPEKYHITKPVRLIELFAGIGSQSKALEKLGVNFVPWKVCEFDKYAVASYNAVHCTNFETSDVSKISGADLEIVDTDKYEYIMTYSFPCFTGDTLVLTRDGLKEIKDITTKDYVLTHDNTYQKVIASKETGEKEIYKIKGMGIDEIRCTSNHKFYTRTMFRQTVTENGKRKSIRSFTPPSWVECKDLNKKSYLGVAINQNSIIPDWDGIDFEWTDGRRTRHKNELSKLMTNNSFWWVIGRYLGDGWIRSNGGIIICCARNETTEIIPHLKNCNFNYSISKERTVNKIHIPIKELEKFVEPFGKGAKNKKLPGFVFDMPCNLLQGLIEGYISADGYIHNNLIKLSSISKELIYGFAQIVAKVYKTPYRIYKNKRKPTVIIEGRKCNQHDGFELVFKIEKRKQDKAFYAEGFIWFPIQSIENTNQIEKVFDIETENNHSFMANGVIAHNCTDLSLAGKRAGMDRNSGTRSSLLWQVERLLTETKELPQILLMENVPQVHSASNMSAFQDWCKFLQDKGYSSYYKDLNAADYGIPQRRMRCIMVSILGDYMYKFPKPLETTVKLDDFLDKIPDPKFYIDNKKSKELINNILADKIKLHKGANGVIVKGMSGDKYRAECKPTDTSSTLCARDWKGFNNYGQTGIVELNGDTPTVDNLRIRRLSTVESWKLMGFTEEDLRKAEKVNSNTQLLKQAGNSIVVDVLVNVFKELF